MLETQPKAFVIALKNHPVSELQLAECLASAKEYNWDVEIFWGVNGKTITDDTWITEGISVRTDKPTINNPGVQGCFLSHWALWNKCIELDEPIIILEHDAVILTQWMPIELNSSIVKLHKHYSRKRIKVDFHSGAWTKSGHAYCISPEHARILVQFVKVIGAYEVDIIMGSNVIPVQHINPSWVERQNTFSTTTTL